jgi:hypothetical protein
VRLSTADIQEGSRSRAAELSDALEDRVFKFVAKSSTISVAKLRFQLEPKLTPAERSLLPLAIYNLINSKRLVLTAGRDLRLPNP